MLAEGVDRGVSINRQRHRRNRHQNLSDSLPILFIYLCINFFIIISESRHIDTYTIILRNIKMFHPLATAGASFTEYMNAKNRLQFIRKTGSSWK